MSDITGQLRSWRHRGDMPTAAIATCMDAANEIDRLRAELEAADCRATEYVNALAYLRAELTEARCALDEARQNGNALPPVIFNATVPQPAVDKGSTHCANCGCDWLDNGLNPVGCPYCKRNDDKFNPCLNSLVRQVALMMDDCEEHADGSITIDCDISQGFLRRIYDLLVALEDCGYDAIEPQQPAATEAVAKDAVPLNSHTRWILSRPNFVCGPVASILRSLGHEIERKAEDEQAAVIHWMLSVYAEYGENWKRYGEKYLAGAKEAAILSADTEVKNGPA